MGSGATKQLDAGHCRHYEQHERTFSKKFLQCLTDVEELYKAEDGRARLGRMLEGSYVILGMCDAVAEETARESYKDQKDPERSKVLQRAMGMLEKLTRCSADVAGTVVSHDRVMPVLLQKLGMRWKDIETNACQPYMDEEKDVLLPSSLRILHTISTYEQHVSALRKLGADNQSTRTASTQELPAIIDVMHTYLNSGREGNRLAAIAVLANTAKDNKDETKGVTTNPVLLTFLVNAASRAVKDRHHVYADWAAGQLLHVLRTLGHKHLVKMALVNAGILDLLKESIESPAKDIRKESMRILTDLSFDNDCAKKITDHDGIVQSLRKKRQEPASAAFLDGDEDATPDAPQTKGKEAEDAEWILLCLSLEKDAEPLWDCFLSYNWTQPQKATAKKLYDYLTKGGLKVWMDDQIIRVGDSIKESMAKGVLQSSVFILCASTQYAESTHCRREAVTAARQKKKICPVLMEERKTIKVDDPWLDDIMKDFKYLDISACHSNDRKFREKAEELLRDLKEHLGKDGQEQPDVSNEHDEGDLFGKEQEEPDQPEHPNGEDLAADDTKHSENYSDSSSTDTADSGLKEQVSATENKKPLRNAAARSRRARRKKSHRPSATRSEMEKAGATSDSRNTDDDGVPSDTESAEDGAPTDRSLGRADALCKRCERNLQGANYDTDFQDGGWKAETTDQWTQSLRPLTARSSLDEEKIRSWTREEIQDWLDRYKLKSPRRSATYLTKCSIHMYHCPMCWVRPDLQEAVLTFRKKKLDKLTGDELIFLHRLYQETPDMFYYVLRKSLEIRSLTGTAKFIKALDSLESE